jgi:hypothetical protein
MTRILGLFIAGVCLTLGLGQPATAQPAGAIAFSPSGTATLPTPIDGLNVSATETCSDGGSARVPVACPQLYLVPGTGISPSFIIEAATGSSILSCSSGSIACNSGGDFDISVDVTVTPVNDQTVLTGASVTVNGTETSAALDRIGGTETVLLDTTQVCGSGLAATAANSDSCTFAGIPGDYLSLTKDFGLHGSGLGPDAVMSLNSITEGFRVPEPASIASLLGGIVMLATMRRKRRRA